METRTPSPRGTALLLAGLASAGAGAVHAAAAGSHSGDPDLAWMFAACAAAQLGWAAAVVAWPRRALLLVGIVLNGGCVAVWVLSRTVGLVGPLAGVESVGTQDLAAAVFGTAAAVAALVELVGRLRRGTGDDLVVRRVDRAVLVVAATLGLVLAVPAMASTHTHDDDDHHGDAAGAVTAASTSATDGHDHTDTAAEHTHDDATPSTASATGPVVSLDDPRLTNAQRARATSLLERTREAMAAYPDPASLEAAGYEWIGDGRTPGRYQHYVNQSYSADGRMLDPAHIESFVLEHMPDGTLELRSAMYIAEPGTTMETVPDVGGELTVWHDHQNLCWSEDGRLAGVVVNGSCRPGGTFRATKPMIHVWLDDPPCGPFTGIEGHGGANCTHEH